MEAQFRQLQEELESRGMSTLPGLRGCGDIGTIPLPKLHSLQSQLRLDLEAVDGVSPCLFPRYQLSVLGPVCGETGERRKAGTRPGAAASSPMWSVLPQVLRWLLTFYFRECVYHFSCQAGPALPFQNLPRLPPLPASCALMDRVDTPLTSHHWNHGVCLGYVTEVTLQGHWLPLA